MHYNAWQFQERYFYLSFFMKKLLIIVTVILTLVAYSQNTANVVAKKKDDDHKIEICHRTNSVTNPYNKIEVDENAADGNTGNNGGQADHFAEHQGPIFDPENPPPPPHNGDQWGDIIPPIEGTHDGLNWTEEGQAIWENDCNFPEGPTPTETEPTPTEEEPTPTDIEEEPTPTETEPTPTATPTETEEQPTSTPTPTEEVRATNPPTPTEGGQGPTSTPSPERGIGGPSVSEQKQGEVLGVSTLAPTGTFESIFATIQQVAGAALATLGMSLYGKKTTSKKTKQ